MNIKSLVVIGAISITALSCASSPPAMEQNTTAKITVSEIVEKQGVNNNTPESHLCGAKTKSGKPCTRKVSDVHGKEALCFQHREK